MGGQAKHADVDVSEDRWEWRERERERESKVSFLFVCLTFLCTKASFPDVDRFRQGNNFHQFSGQATSLWFKSTSV